MLRAPVAANVVAGAQEALPVSNQTLRQLVRVGLAGSQLRIVLDNRFGSTPVNIDGASIGRQDVGATLKAGSIGTVHFHGKPRVTLAPGAVVHSDPVAMDVHPGEVLGVSLYVAGRQHVETWHPDPPNASYISGPGDRTQALAIDDANGFPGIAWLARVDVQSSNGARAIVALGDSITNGFRASALVDWPDMLQDRLDAARCPRAVLNAGIDGNQVAAANGSFGLGEPMRDRVGNDVLAASRVRYLIVLGGVNDIGLSTMAAHRRKKQTPDAGALAGPVIAAQKAILDAARARGLRVYGATILPFEGTTQTYTPQGEAAREQINAWIRGPAGYDHVIDFDAALRDPDHPRRLRKTYDSGDNLHPSDAGYRAMAGAIPLNLFDCH